HVPGRRAAPRRCGRAHSGARGGRPKARSTRGLSGSARALYHRARFLQERLEAETDRRPAACPRADRRKSRPENEKEFRGDLDRRRERRLAGCGFVRDPGRRRYEEARLRHSARRRLRGLDHLGMTLFLKGLAFGFVLAATVGPMWILCFRRTVAQGPLAG